MNCVSFIKHSSRWKKLVCWDECLYTQIHRCAIVRGGCSCLMSRFLDDTSSLVGKIMLGIDRLHLKVVVLLLLDFCIVYVQQFTGQILSVPVL